MYGRLHHIFFPRSKQLRFTVDNNPIPYVLAFVFDVDFAFRQKISQGTKKKDEDGDDGDDSPKEKKEKKKKVMSSR